jgi:Tol biopolymer transport system component
MGDSLVTVCPGGDSVVAGHPSVLRIAVTYADASGAAKVGVPPDSVWATLEHTGNGALVLQDATTASDGFQWKVFADDPTDGNGLARISLVGFSGCGDVYVRVYVSGVLQGTRVARVRSLDADVHDPVDAVIDSVFACDWNYSGAVDSSDYALLHAHDQHGHRNALHGTLAKRTSLCDTCGREATNTLGDSQISWSPDGRRLAFTVFSGPTADCIINTVPSDPKDGNSLTPFVTPPSTIHDYDPEWSPLGTEILFDRGDSTIYRGSYPSGTLTLLTHHDNLPNDRVGDVMPAVSPDGKWVAFCRKAAEGPFQLWKIAIEGTPGGATAVQLTSQATMEDIYPRWSPNGDSILFDRRPPGGIRQTYRIHKDGGAVQAVLTPSNTFAVMPAYSPDGVVMVTSNGHIDSSSTRVTRANLVGLTSEARSVSNYPQFSEGTEDDLWGPLPAPRFSPDGTRLAVKARRPGTSGRPQLWAARRNMSLPPSISAVGGTAVVDSTPVVNLVAYVGYSNSWVVEASDPESDELTYKAYFLRSDLGMSFDESAQTLSWTPSLALDLTSTYNVRFQVETVSGGTDYAIAHISLALAPGGGGCPTLSSYTGTGWRTDNTILGRSKTGIYLVDAYKLREKPARVQDRYRLQIRETEQEKTTLDQVRLLAVDHDPKLEAVASEGTVWLGERKPAYRVRTSGGQDVTHPLGGLFGGSPGEILLVEMDDPQQPSQPGPGIFDGGGGEKEGPQPGNLKPAGAVTASALDASVLDGSGYSVEDTDGAGGWNPLASFYPREHSGETAIEGAGHGVVRVAFKGRQHLTFIGKLAGATKATPQELPLVIARHSRFKDVKDAVATQGSQATTIEPGESLDLEFAAPPVPEGLRRDLFLVSRGVYTAYLPNAVQSGLPVRFALAQNQPNPFGSATRIRFELPVRARVRLEVFDLLGRRIRVLSDGEFDAGYQSAGWDGKDRSGSVVGPGIYLYRMTAPGFRDQKKMVVLP